MKLSQFDTILGPMIAIADDQALYLLEFIGRKKLDYEIERLKVRTKSEITIGINEPIHLIQKDIEEYFKGTLTEFKTPFFLSGTPFQQKVWQELRKIPYGKTISYADLAKSIGKPTAFRAVANANGCNQLALIIPCHRVINSNGALGGYGGGIAHKQWLLNHENSKKLYHHDS